MPFLPLRSPLAPVSACGAGVVPQGLGRVDHPGRGGGRPGDLHAALPAGDRAGLEGLRVRRLEVPRCRAAAGAEVHAEEADGGRVRHVQLPAG